MSTDRPETSSKRNLERETSMQQRVIGLMASLLLTASVLAPAVGNAQDIQERTLKFPSASNKGHPQVMGVEKFAELVEEKSGGKITVKTTNPNGETTTVYALEGGNLVVETTSPGREGGAPTTRKQTYKKG